jgi:hypothetical protein
LHTEDFLRSDMDSSRLGAALSRGALIEDERVSSKPMECRHSKHALFADHWQPAGLTVWAGRASIRAVLQKTCLLLACPALQHRPQHGLLRVQWNDVIGQHQIRRAGENGRSVHVAINATSLSQVTAASLTPLCDKVIR